MAEINLTLNLPGITAEDLSAVLAPLLSSSPGGAALSLGGPTTLPHRKALDPDEQITLKQAVAECALSYHMLRAQVVDDDQIPYTRKSASRKSTILIYRRDLWSLLDAADSRTDKQPLGGRPRSSVSAADIVLGA